MGGVAFRAPVLAGLFLIVALATLAMPGSANFVGELLILFGALSTKLAFGLVAGGGVVLSAVYMIRLYQRSMHNRVGAGVESRDLTRAELVTIAPLVAVILALGFYPHFIVRRTEAATVPRVFRAAALAHERGAQQPDQQHHQRAARQRQEWRQAGPVDVRALDVSGGEEKRHLAAVAIT